MNKEAVKLEIKKLVEKYQRMAEADEIKTYNEARTRNEFIEPFFEFLGWDMRNTATDNEVTTEESVSGGRVDLAFRINNIPAMFLEAKAMRVDLDVETYSRQAINYAWNKGVSYAVLTDFESIKLYNAQAESKSLMDKLIFEIPWKEYIKDFDRVWLLSKESFIAGALDEYAQKYGKMKKRLTVNEKLFDDLKRAREILLKAFGEWNKDVKQEDLEEGVQRILDRLVFIRVLEDRKLEPQILKEVSRACEQDKSKDFFSLLIKKFRELDEYYDSSIFKKHACEEWKEYTDKAFGQVVNLLYGTEMYTYDFKEIPADILGGVYESYLGYISKQKGVTKKELKAAGYKKRKEHGIYYTPHYIVDFIVKETLGEKLKEVKSINELNKIKILDPACGSGSFLVRALRTMNDKYKEFGGPGDTNTKSAILSSNIYGVDLDAQAIELAKLNLLIEALDKKAKLPDITPHIREGNSLISGDAEKLEKYFGKKWRDKKPFDFQDEFSNVFEQGGFDVIIGNPPYVRVDNLPVENKEFWKEEFKTSEGKYDLYYLFIEKSISLLKKNGVLGFIVPNKFCVADSAKRLRKVIFDLSASCNFFSVSMIDIFKDAANYPIIIILNKGGGKQKISFSFANNKEEILSKKFNSYFVDKNDLKALPSNIIPVNVTRDQLNLTTKLLKRADKLSKYLKISEGLRIPERYESEKKEKFGIVKQYQFSRYSELSQGSYISEDNLLKVINKKSERFINSLKDKIIIAEDALFITATMDRGSNIPQGGVYFGTLVNQKISLGYLLALLNSKLLSFVYKTLFGGMHMGGGYLRYRTAFLDELPTKITDDEGQEMLASLAGEMVELSKKLRVSPENSDRWRSLKSEIEKTDKLIDQKVYELYGLTKQEVAAIEGEK